jgi:large subunit ribosomal protein L28e
MKTKIASRTHKPAHSTHQASYSASTPSRKLYKSVVGSTAKKGYRSDLRQDAVARASAIKLSQRNKKETPQAKLRGSKAKKAASS